MAVMRECVPGDFTAVFALFGQLWPGRALDVQAMRAVFDRALAGGTDVLLCAEQDGAVVGFCCFAVVNNFWQEGRIAYIYAMVVDEVLRGQGVGSSLMAAAEDRAAELGCKRIELDSGFQRGRAHRFYERIGYEKRAWLFSKEPVRR